MFVHSEMENHQIFSDSKSVGDFTYRSQIFHMFLIRDIPNLKVMSLKKLFKKS